MITRIAKLVMAAAAMAAFSSSSFGMLVYTYTGNPFTTFDVSGSPPSTYAGSNAVTGFISLTAPLGGSLTDQSVSPIDFRFTDGLQTFTPFNSVGSHGTEELPPVFNITTDPTGQITSWIVHLVTASADHPGLVRGAIASFNDLHLSTRAEDVGSIIQLGEFDPVRGCCLNFPWSALGHNADTPGRWVALGPPAVPEPTALSWLGGGLLASLLYHRRRRGRNIVSKQ